MTATHDATLSVARYSLAMMRAAVEGLPEPALEWTPASGMNSLAVHVEHGIVATRFWARCGTGEAGSLARFRAEEREASFRVKGLSAIDLLAHIDAFEAELAELLESGVPAHLEAWVAWPEVPGMERSGATCLIHAVAHLREHVGHAQAVRDLWMATGPQNSWR
ncbi:MAG: DinB family protein [Tepidiformaceae bacterium]